MSMADQFEPLEVIGRGSFGLIRKVRRKSDGKILARKEISYRQMNIKEKNQLMSEFRILKSLVHPNIVRYYYHDHVIQEHAVHLYMEYCDGGDLAGVIRTCKQTGEYVPESLVWSVFTQLALALFRCHYNSDPPPPDDIGSNVQATEPSAPSTIILHRDIKPDNVFLDQHNTVKLGDFGLAKILDQEHVLANTYVGTPYYMSPEVLNDQPSTPQSDVWSLGCVMYELCAQHPPFQAKSHIQLSQRIREGNYPPLPSVYSELLGSTIASCLTQDYRNRPTTSSLIHTSMFNFCRKERQVESMRREVEAAHVELDRARVEIDQARKEVTMARSELQSKERVLSKKEEDIGVEREKLLKQFESQQESLQTKMIQTLNDEFSVRVEEEVQKRLDVIMRENRSTSKPIQRDRFLENRRSPSPLMSGVSGTPKTGSSAQFASPIEAHAPLPRSAVKGPRTIRDSSLNSNIASRSPRKHFSFEETHTGEAHSPTGHHSPCTSPIVGYSHQRLEHRISGQSLASHTSHNSRISHTTSVSRAGSNASTSSRMASPTIPSHQFTFSNIHESKQHQLQKSPNKSNNSPILQQQHQVTSPSPLSIKTFERLSLDKEMDISPTAMKSGNIHLPHTQHTGRVMEEISSNSSVSTYSSQSSHFSASSNSSFEAEGAHSGFSSQALAGYPSSQQGQSHNLHLFEAKHKNTPKSSHVRNETMFGKSDDVSNSMLALDDNSLSTLQGIDTQYTYNRYQGDEDDIMDYEPSYDHSKSKNSFSIASSSASTITSGNTSMSKTSSNRSAAALAMMVEPPSILAKTNRNDLVSSNALGGRAPGRKSPSVFSPSTPRDRQAPHFQAIYSSEEKPKMGGVHERSGSPTPSLHHTPSHSSAYASTPVRSRSPNPQSFPSALRPGGVRIVQEESRSQSPVIYDNNENFPVTGKYNTSTVMQVDLRSPNLNNSRFGGVPMERDTPPRKVLSMMDNMNDGSRFEAPASSVASPLSTENQPFDTASALAGISRRREMTRRDQKGLGLNVDTSISTPKLISAISGLTETGTASGNTPGSRDRDKERDKIVASGFVRRRCETWDENWNSENNATRMKKNEALGGRDTSPSPFMKRRERRV